MQQILTLLTSLATIAAGVAAVVGLGSVITSGARLRRTEAQWREIVQAERLDGTELQLRLARDFHRLAATRLVARELVSPRLLTLAWLFTLSVMVSVGGLAFQVVDDIIREPEAPWRSSISDVLGGGVLESVIAVVFLLVILGEPLVVLAGLYSARRNIARAALRNETPILKFWSSDGFAYLLSQHLGARYLTLLIKSLGLTISVATACLGTGIAVRLLWEAIVRGPLDPNLFLLQVVSSATMVAAWMLAGLLAASLLTPSPVLNSPALQNISTRNLVFRRFTDQHLRVGVYLPEEADEPDEGLPTNGQSSHRPRLSKWLLAGGIILALRMRMKRT